ncbi:hypothetical protein GOBAR_DD36471 [Gossypium barbadense]|nr:hypothetical protein GOBAR_DD36471 [Gossypium barbadense]
MVSLMIIDECHHATGNHPYAKIIKVENPNPEFYHKLNKPKIFGMTASPVVSKGALSNNDYEDQISELENVMDCTIYTIEDMTEMETYVPTAKESRRFFDPTRFYSSGLKAMIEASWLKMDASLSTLQGSIHTSYTDMDDKFKALHKRSSNDHAKILHCLDDLGLICAYEAVKVCLENIPGTKEDYEAHRVGVLQCKRFDYLKAIDSGYISPKLHELIELLLSLGEPSQVLCLVFVERIVTAKVIERFVKQVSCLSCFVVSCLTGSNTSVDSMAPKIQKETLESCQSGKKDNKTAMLSSTTADDVLDVCLTKTQLETLHKILDLVVSPIQQEFNTVLPNDNTSTEVQQPLGQGKQQIQVYSRRNRSPETDTAVPITSPTEDYSKAKVPPPSPSIYLPIAVQKGTRSCTQHNLYALMIRYFMVNDCGVCSVWSYVQSRGRARQSGSQFIMMLERGNEKQRDQLYDIIRSEHSVTNTTMNRDPDISPEKSTTRRKEQHGTTQIRALSGSWGEKADALVFFAYKIDFSCNVVSDVYSEFVLLIESKLADDVGNIEVDLYLIGKIAKARVSFYGKVHLDAVQITAAKRFQEIFFNGLFGRLFVGSSGTSRELLFYSKTSLLWHPSNMYLLLPLEDSLKHKETNVIHFANRSIDVNNISNIVVLAIHTGRIYSTIELVHDTSAKSSFNNIADMNSSKLATFSEYYNRKYRIVLKHPGQPLLLLKQSHNPHNLLVDFNDEDFSAQALQASSVNEKSWNNIHMPPDLLLVLDVPIYVLKAFYLLPSLMHRLESLMLASQLREEIDFHSSNFDIPSSLLFDGEAGIARGFSSEVCCELPPLS